MHARCLLTATVSHTLSVAVELNSVAQAVKVDGMPATALASCTWHGAWNNSDITVAAPQFWSGVLDFTVRAASVDGTAVPATAEEVVTVEFSEIANTPTLSVVPSLVVDEDAMAALPITATAPDPGDTLTLDLVTDCNLVVAADAVEVPGSFDSRSGTCIHRIAPPSASVDVGGVALWSGTSVLTVVATTEAGGDTAQASESVAVTITPVPSAPALNVSALSMAIAEGEVPAVGVAYLGASLDDALGPDVVLTLELRLPSDSPVLAVAGTPINLGPGITPVLVTTGVNNITTPLNVELGIEGHWSGSFAVDVALVAFIGSASAETVQQFDVVVEPVATQPSLDINEESAVVNEDAMTPFTVNDVSLVDTDGSETLSLHLQLVAVPNEECELYIVQVDDTQLVPNSQAWCAYSLPATAGLMVAFGGAPNVAGSVVVQFVARATESGGSQPSVVTSSTAHVTIVGVADAPTLQLSTTSLTISEGDTATVNIVSVAVVDPVRESLSLAVRVTSAGPVESVLADGVEQLSGQLGEGGVVELPLSSEIATLAVACDPMYSGSFIVAVVATATQSGSVEETVSNVTVVVEPVATTPELSLVNSTLTVQEDTPGIAFVDSVALTDGDGSETLVVHVRASGVACAAATIVASDVELVPSPLTGEDCEWILPDSVVDTPSAVTITPLADFAGSLVLAVVATSTEVASQDEASASMPFTLVVTAVADQPTIAVVPAAVVVTQGDAAVAATTVVLTDTDASERATLVVAGPAAGVANVTTLGAEVSCAVEGAGDEALHVCSLFPIPTGTAFDVAVATSASYVGNMQITFTAVATETGNGDTATVSDTVTIEGTSRMQQQLACMCLLNTSLRHWLQSSHWCCHLTSSHPRLWPVRRTLAFLWGSLWSPPTPSAPTTRYVSRATSLALAVARALTCGFAYRCCGCGSCARPVVASPM